jgi:hypothetical protein
MKSRPSSARARRSPLGADSTGLVASVTSARTWPLPGVSISSARQPIGSSPHHLGCAAHAAGVAAHGDAPADARRAGGVGRKAAALGNIAPPGASRWPRQRVEHIDQPGRTAAIFLGAAADAGIDRWRGAVPPVRGQPRMVSAAMPQRSATASALKGWMAAPMACSPQHMVPTAPRRAAVRRTAGVHHAGQQEGVGPGADEVVGIGQGRGLGAARVDHDQPAAAGLHGAWPCRGSRARSTCCRC